MVGLNFDAVKEPRGFMKVLQFVSIFNITQMQVISYRLFFIDCILYHANFRIQFVLWT